MAILKKSCRVLRSDGYSSSPSPGSKGSISADDSDHRPESSGVSEVDSGMELDGCEESVELGKPGTELCQVGDRRFGVPLELYDLPDLYSVLSLDTWNELLSEEDRFALAEYLPDMDQETFSWTLKELFSGGNFHFGSPLAEFFGLLKGGKLEPTVVLYRQSLHVIKRREYYRFLHRYQDSMVGRIVGIRDAWQRCVGYGIKERMRVLNILRSQRPMLDGGGVFDGSVMDLEDEPSLEKVGRKRLKMSSRALRLSKPSLNESVVFRREIPKGILKVVTSNTSGKEYFGARSQFASPVEQDLQVKATMPISLKPLPLQDRVDRLRYGTIQRPKHQKRARDGDAGYLEEWGDEMAVNEDWDASHENAVARANLQKPGKKQVILGAYDRGNQMGYRSEHHVELLHSLRSSRNATQEVTIACYDRHPQENVKAASFLEKGQSYPVKIQRGHQEVADFGGKKLKEEERLRTSKSKTGSDPKLRCSSFLEQIGESHFRYAPTAKAAKGKTGSIFVHGVGRNLNSARDNTVFDRGEETESDSSEQFEEVGDASHVVRQLAEPSGSIEDHQSGIIRSAYNPERATKISKERAYADVNCNMRTMKDALDQTSRDVHLEANRPKKSGQAIDARIVETDFQVQLNLSLSGCTSMTKKQRRKVDISRLDEADESHDLLSTPKRMDDPDLMRNMQKSDAEVGSGSFAALAHADSILTKRMKNIDQLPEKPFILITPTIHTGFSFSIIHFLSAIRKAMVTATEDTMELHHHFKKDDVMQNLKREAQDMNTADHAGQNILPSLTVHEIVNRVRLNPGDPYILETQEPLEDLVRGALKIFSSKTAPLGAKGWKALVHYEKSNKSWSWIGPSSILFDDNVIEEDTSSEAWGIPHKTLVKLVDAFANWLKNGQEILKQIGSLPAPPMIILSNMDETERFKDLKTQKCPITISSSSEEAREYFHREEILRYSIPDRAFSYTAADGKKSTVAPLRRGGGKPTSKGRDHFMLKPDRPPHVTILCLVRDAAARLPGSIGTRADVCTLIRDSQYISEDVSDRKVNQIVSGALDRLHYERDPCVLFDSDRKLWVYLHRDREEEDFDDDGTSSTKKWKKTVKYPLGHSDMGDASDVNYHEDENIGLVGNDATSEVSTRLIVDSAAGNRSQGNLMMQEVHRSNFYGEHEMLCQENSRNKDFGDEGFNRKRPVRRLTASLS